MRSAGQKGDSWLKWNYAEIIRLKRAIVLMQGQGDIDTKCVHQKLKYYAFYHFQNKDIFEKKK